MLIQLEPFLRKHPPLPPEPTRSGIPLVDWETYPPAHLLRSLAQRRPAQVASVIQRISTQEIPLKPGEKNIEKVQVSRLIESHREGYLFKNSVQLLHD